eukprot:1410861-Pleurochrysis_carterae.AAC.1
MSVRVSLLVCACACACADVGVGVGERVCVPSHIRINLRTFARGAKKKMNGGMGDQARRQVERWERGGQSMSMVRVSGARWTECKVREIGDGSKGGVLEVGAGEGRRGRSEKCLGTSADTSTRDRL